MLKIIDLIKKLEKVEKINKAEITVIFLLAGILFVISPFFCSIIGTLSVFLGLISLVEIIYEKKRV